MDSRGPQVTETMEIKTMYGGVYYICVHMFTYLHFIYPNGKIVLFYVLLFSY
jgi:hypothetical protein